MSPTLRASTSIGPSSAWRSALSSRSSIAWRTREGSARRTTSSATVHEIVRPSALARDAYAVQTLPTRSWRSTGILRTGRRPPRTRARTSRSSASRTRRSASADAFRRASRISSGSVAFAAARSSSIFSTASGVRSSWLAWSRNRPSRRNASSSRASNALRVEPSLESSSSAGESCSRRSSSDSEMALASRRIRSTGRSAAAARIQPPNDTMASAAEPNTASRSVSRASDSFRSPSVDPTTTNSDSPGRRTGTVRSRTGSSTPATRVVSEAGPFAADRSSAGDTMGAAATPRLVSTMRPEGDRTWANASSGSIRLPPATITEGSCRAIAARMT